jgi:hypothetical protein
VARRSAVTWYGVVMAAEERYFRCQPQEDIPIKSEECKVKKVRVSEVRQ